MGVAGRTRSWGLVIALFLLATAAALGSLHSLALGAQTHESPGSARGDPSTTVPPPSQTASLFPSTVPVPDPVQTVANSSLQFVNDRDGWLADGTVFATTDGGVTWVTTSNPGDVYNIHFVNAVDGWALTGEPGEQSGWIHTVNGGRTWNALPQINDPAKVDF